MNNKRCQCPKCEVCGNTESKCYCSTCDCCGGKIPSKLSALDRKLFDNQSPFPSGGICHQ